MDVLKLPPYGKSLAFQLATGKEPLFVAVCVGNNCWDRAKYYLDNEVTPPLVLPKEDKPSDYSWDVDGCPVVVDVDEDVADVRWCELVSLLLKAGAPTVFVMRPWAVNSVTKYYQGCSNG
jgi:hypothetical protein